MANRGARREGHQKQLEKLRADAAECRLISDLATDPAKRELFDRLALHLTTLADQLEEAILHCRRELREAGAASADDLARYETL